MRHLLPGRVFLLIMLMVLAASGTAGARDRGLPITLAEATAGLDQVMVRELEPIFPEELLAEDAARAARAPVPLRYAVPEAVGITPDNAGTWEELADGSRLWRLRVSAPNATDLNFGFTRFRLPPGASLFVIAEPSHYVRGPYTAADNRPDGELWTPVVPGSTAIVELHIPRAPSFTPEVELGQVERGYRDLFKLGLFQGAGSCNIDVICPPGDDWRDEIHSVARYSVSGSGGSFLCTGQLVADATGDLRPLFLSAKHCGVDATTDQSLVSYWDYHAPICGSLAGGSLNKALSGSTYLAGRADADFALVELDQTPPPDYHPYWGGWDRRADHTPQGGTAIHHPSGGVKAISVNDDPLTTIPSLELQDETGNVVTTVITPWRVNNWELGTTEPGSSGGGLWDPDTHLLVGVLSGGSASCSNPGGSDYFARLSVAWDGGTSEQRLSDWLDPNASGAQTAAGRYPFSCGNAAYDDGTPVGTADFGGGLAGDPTHMLAVRFRLQDLGYAPGQTRLIGFCASNQLVVAGGPFTNTVVVYPDKDGLPDTGVVLAQGTISTGDGNGDSVVDLARPVTLTGDFWLVVRGAAATSGESFNLEYDAGPNSGASFSSATGVAGLTTANDPGGHPGGVNYALRAHLESITPGAFSYVTGGIARLQGALGTNWRSKLALLNRSGAPASVDLSYIRDAATTTATIVLADGQLRSWDDVVTELFGVAGKSSGAVRVDSDRPLVVTARTYNLLPEGTVGQFLPGLKASDTVGAGETTPISQLADNADFRSNIGFASLTAAQCRAEVQLHNADGTAIGTPITATVPPLGWAQVNDVFASAGASNRDHAYALVRVLTPGCRLWGYGSVVDNATGDPTTIPVFSGGVPLGNLAKHALPAPKTAVDAFSCGNAGYDDNVAAGAAFFGGGNAGDPDYMFAVRFRLADFGYGPDQARLTAFCAGGGLAFEGGPWPNRVFVYPDLNGLPDDSQVLAEGTVTTGDGGGDSVVTLSAPVTLGSDFWLVVRGNPQFAGEDFNVEFDGGPNTGSSYVSNTGIAGLSVVNDPSSGDYPDGVNYLLRATLEPIGGAVFSYRVAGVARIRGAEGTDWRTTLALLNQTTGSASADLSYIREDGTTQARVTLAPGELMTYDDVVSQLFGVAGRTSGAVEVASDRPLVVTARTYNLLPDGTVGQFLPGVASSETVSTGDTALLSQLVGNAAFRSNIGFVNFLDTPCTMRVQLHGAGGGTVGSAVDLALPPSGWAQINDVFTAAHAGSHDNAYATAEALDAGCLAWGYASVVDNVTGDPTTIPMAVQQ